MFRICTNNQSAAQTMHIVPVYHIEQEGNRVTLNATHSHVVESHQCKNPSQAEALLRKHVDRDDHSMGSVWLDSSDNIVCGIILSTDVSDLRRIISSLIVGHHVLSRAVRVVTIEFTPERRSRPSSGAVRRFSRMWFAARLCGVPLADHLTFDGRDVISFYDSGYFNRPAIPSVRQPSPVSSRLPI